MDNNAKIIHSMLNQINVGSVLVGSKDFIKKARRWRKVFAFEYEKRTSN